VLPILLSLYPAGQQPVTFQQPVETNAGDAPGKSQRLADQPPADFRLSPGDVVEVKFLYTPELDDTVQIRSDGRISLAMIGEVAIGGRTLHGALQELQARYSKVLKAPSISMQVRNFSGHKVFVGGEVTRPGMFDLASDVTVMDALLQAGGPKYTASKYALLIRRSDNERPSIRKISLERHRMEAAEATMIRLEPFDVVMVPESKIAHTDRWVDQHIRQLIPANLGVGFSYLFNGTVIP
jgi:protein involved in polysaccharide export with SLBB domain